MSMSCSNDLYDRYAQSYSRSHDRWLRYEGGEAQCAFEGAVTALLRPGMRVLDAACGTGKVARRMLGGVYGAIDLVLLDAAQGMLDLCEDISAERVRACMMDLPFPDDNFDLLTCAWGIETLEDPSAALSEFLRVTRPGGQVCLVFCADRPVRSILGNALCLNIRHSQRGTFLDHRRVCDMASGLGVRHIQVLHNTGPAAAMILHI